MKLMKLGWKFVRNNSAHSCPFLPVFSGRVRIARTVAHVTKEWRLKA